MSSQTASKRWSLVSLAFSALSLALVLTIWFGRAPGARDEAATPERPIDSSTAPELETGPAEPSLEPRWFLLSSN